MIERYQWGPWITHDGSGLPDDVLGRVVHVVYADGAEVLHLMVVDGWSRYLKDGKLYDGPAYQTSWRWVPPQTSWDCVPVERYRIAKPTGLVILEKLIADAPKEVAA